MKHALLYFVILSTLLACRKDIIHKVGVYPQKGEEVEEEADWEEITGAPEDITSLESYGGLLYIGSADPNFDEKHLMVYDGSSLKQALSGTLISSGVYDIHTLNNRMYVGGEFSYHAGFKSYTNLINLTGSTWSGIDFGDFLFSSIDGMTTFNGDLLLRGYFKDDDENINTNFLERISTTLPIGFGNGLSEEITEFKEYQGKLYIAGEGTVEGVGHLLAYWNGSSWQNAGAESNSGIIEYGWALETYKDKLYFAHNKDWATSNTYLRVYDGSTWKNIPEVDLSTSDRTYFKKLGDYLYFFGKGIYFDGSITSNVLRFDGQNWSTVGTLTDYVVDLALYNNDLYAATRNGFYKIEL